VISHHGKHWNFDNLRIVPRPLQQPSPPKWTTVVSPATATISAGRRSKICTAFESVARIKEIFDAYRAEADRTDFACGPDHLAMRRNITIAASEAEALDTAQIAKEMTRKVLAGDPRVKAASSSLLDAKTGFVVHDDEFIAGTPTQVAEQIVAQCRACGAGHFLAILGRAVDEHRVMAVNMFGEQVIPILRRADIA
jgi:alkanesulfonate monooxygenase SsuD/methylene tetrahydromethanopterin reductase-like flavin-dependent oxidoreductase (luciferase family)